MVSSIKGPGTVPPPTAQVPQDDQGQANAGESSEGVTSAAAIDKTSSSLSRGLLSSNVVGQLQTLQSADGAPEDKSSFSGNETDNGPAPGEVEPDSAADETSSGSATATDAGPAPDEVEAGNSADEKSSGKSLIYDARDVNKDGTVDIHDLIVARSEDS